MFGILAYSAILAACVAGMTFHFAWMVPLSALVLVTISSIENRALYRRAYYGPEESQGFAIVTVIASFFNGLIASGAAYILGAIVGTVLH